MKNHCKTIQCQGSDIASYLGQFNTDDAIQYTNGLLRITTPVGVVTIPPNTIVVIAPSTGGGTTSGPFVLTYQGCKSLISFTVPAGSTQAQIAVIAQEVMAQAAAQYALCNPPNNPNNPPHSPVFLNPQIVIVTDCTADAPLSVTVSLFPGLTISGNNFVLAAGLFTSNVSVEDATNLAASFAQSFVNNLFATGGASCGGLLAGLQVYYRLDEVSGTRFDVNGQNPLLEVNPPVPSVPGIIGLAVDATQTGKVLVSNSAFQPFNIPLNSSATISYWQKGDNPGNALMAYQPDPTNLGFVGWYIALELSYTMSFVWRYDPSPEFDLLNASFPQPIAASWNHVVFVMDIVSGTGKTYINGVLAATASGYPMWQYDSSYKLGIIYLYVDELGFWKRALSPAEILKLYNGGAGLTYPFS